MNRKKPEKQSSTNRTNCPRSC